jgi:hypothetical protein
MVLNSFGRLNGLRALFPTQKSGFARHWLLASYTPLASETYIFEVGRCRNSALARATVLGKWYFLDPIAIGFGYTVPQPVATMQIPLLSEWFSVIS